MNASSLTGSFERALGAPELSKAVKSDVQGFGPRGLAGATRTKGGWAKKTGVGRGCEVLSGRRSCDKR